ncbi:unnamed protein product, partial [Meganyctiphanes norvegica]
TGMPLPDLRGKHGGHPHISEARIRLVQTHISNFPTVSSQYSSKTMPSVKYLEPNIKNKKHLYNLYKEWIQDKYPEEEPVSNHFYLDILRRDFKYLKISKIRKDTCNSCDCHN